jgi:hypothetical protein
MAYSSYDFMDRSAYYAQSFRKTSRLSKADLWALAIGAVYARIGRTNYDRLAPFSTPVFVGYSRRLLRESWGVDGKAKPRHDQMIDLFQWLATAGHRAEFAAPGDREAWLDLLAWDITRSVNIARHGFLARHVSADEAWSHIRSATKVTQETFSSWEDFGRRFLRGRMRWNGEADEGFSKAVEWLLKSSKSPWRRLEWRTSLTPPA